MKARKVAVLNVVGLTQELVSRMPKLAKFANNGMLSKIQPVFPALTCPAQATYLTGESPDTHGVIGNGWYFKDLAQVMFWRQSHHLMQGSRLWDEAKRLDPSFTSANLFWWFNMYSSVDFSVTPRPIYRADGLKLPDIYTFPSEWSETLQTKLGSFPLFHFWGPAADIRSTRWIAEASLITAETHHPSLLLVYLPHLDYCLQREGPLGLGLKKELESLDGVLEELIHRLQILGYEIIILSEYGIQQVESAIPINRIFREKNWLRVRTECGEDHFDAGASEVFAVVDHQIAHITLNNPKRKSEVMSLLENHPGVSRVLDEGTKPLFSVNHSRSGDLIAISKKNSWFSYRYWLDDRKAPDYARTVDIHRKPGYDPVELFLEQNPLTKLKMAARLATKKLGFRYRMDVISLDESLVKGSHGSTECSEEFWPVFITENSEIHQRHLQTNSSVRNSFLKAKQIKKQILAHLFPGGLLYEFEDRQDSVAKHL